MVWMTPREQQDDTFGFAEAAKPSLGMQMRARYDALTEGILDGTPGIIANAELRFLAPRMVEGMDERMSKQDAVNFAKGYGITLEHGVDDSGITKGELAVITARQMDRRDRQQRIAAAGLSGPDAFVSQMAGSVLDPINLIPFFGAEATASRVGLGAALARGAGEGLVANAAIEPFMFTGSRYGGDDYNMLDSVKNVALGGAIGSALHGFGHVIGKWSERRVAGPGALTQVAEDRPVNVEPFMAPEPEQVASLLRAADRDPSLGERANAAFERLTPADQDRVSDLLKRDIIAPSPDAARTPEEVALLLHAADRDPSLGEAAKGAYDALPPEAQQRVDALVEHEMFQKGTTPGEAPSIQEVADRLARENPEQAQAIREFAGAFEPTQARTPEAVARLLRDADRDPALGDRAQAAYSALTPAEQDRVAALVHRDTFAPSSERPYSASNAMRAAAEHMAAPKGRALLGEHGARELENASKTKVEVEKREVKEVPEKVSDPRTATAKEFADEAVAEIKDDPRYAKQLADADENIREADRLSKAIEAATLCARTNGAP